MKQTISLRILSLLLAAALSAACSDDESRSQPATPSITFADEPQPVFGAGGGSLSVAFTSTAAWTAETDQDWCGVSPAGGEAGSCNVVLTVAENDTPDERNATLVLRSGSVTGRLTLVQKQQDALAVTSRRIEVGAEGGEVTVEVHANVDFEYAIGEEASEWLTLVQTRALATTQLQFQVAANESSEKREGKIVLSGGGLSETVTVYQDGETPQIVLTQNEYTVPSGGDTLVIEVRSNVPCEMRLPAGADWLSEVATRSVSTYTRRILVAPNDTYDYRTAQIAFVDEETGAADTVTVTQVQLDAILVAQPEYVLGHEGCLLRFSINTNVGFEVSLSADWIRRASDTRALVEVPVCFEVDANETDEAREAAITFTAGGLRQTVTVRQYSRQDENVLRIVHTATTFGVPLLSGPCFANGRILWGDGEEETYSGKASHTYENSGTHTVTIESMGAETMTLDNLVDVAGLDLSGF